MARFKNTDKEMSFLDHLEDLRWHLIRSFLSVIVLASIAFLAKDFIFNVLIFGPKHSDFPTYKILCEIAQFIGFKDSFCFTELQKNICIYIYIYIDRFIYLVIYELIYLFIYLW